MKCRAASSQSVHDRVVWAISGVQTEHDAHCNPGQDHNVSVNIEGQTVYPDLVLCTRGTMTVMHLVEVETAESVTDAEAAQWAVYARGPGQFWLMVPSEQLATAQTICRRKGVVAGFGRWWCGQQGIGFEWLDAVAAAR